MIIEKNEEKRTCNIWVDWKSEAGYKNDSRYQETIKECKAKGFTVCVYIGGELPILSVIDDAIMSNHIIA